MDEISPRKSNMQVPQSPTALPAYEQWMRSTGVPIHRGYFVSDLRTLEVGLWSERGCNAAFLQLAGQEGVSEARLTEIPAGKTLPSMRFILDEVIYVAEGRGVTTVWPEAGPRAKTFEWSKHSVFMLPRHTTFQLTNMDGSRPARLLSYNYAPIVMELAPDESFFFNGPYTAMGEEEEIFATAQAHTIEGPRGGRRNVWRGNFFPDMAMWDQLEPMFDRGGSGRSVTLQFPNSPIRSHMAVFPSRTYKKAHRHGPGVVIVIPAGEGYSIMWQEGHDKVLIPWQEGSVFVPPDGWFHQHFNVGGEPARYLAFHMPWFMRMTNEKVEDVERNQIEYTDEDPWVRRTFEEELGKRGLESLMPDRVYRERNFEWRDDEDQQS